LKEAGVDSAKLTIAEELWPKLVRPLGFDPGLRSLHRLIETIIRRAAYKIVQGQGESFTINETNVKEFTS
jgi:ATP-dependent Lon protease